MWAGAVAGDPAENGGCGSYSIPSWMAWATSSPAMRAASVSAMSMPDDTPGAVLGQAIERHPVRGGLEAAQDAGGGQQHRAGAHRRGPLARLVRRADPV